MGELKGSVLAYIKNTLKKMGPDAEAQFLASLTPDESLGFTRSLSISWIPIRLVATFYEKAAPILFPEEPQMTVLYRFGKESMKSTVNQFYQLLMKCLSPNQLMEHTARFWRVFNSEGSPVFEKLEKTKVIFKLDYPDFPKIMYQTLGGSIAAMVEMTGVKNVLVTYESGGNDLHKWIIIWKN